MPERKGLAAVLSMRTRLILATGLACLATLLTGSVAMYVALGEDDDEMLDGRLVALGSVVLSFAEHEIAEVEAAGRTDSRVADVDAAFVSLYRFQVWSPNGRLLLRSSKAPGVAPMAPLQTNGFRDIKVDGERFRLLAMSGPGGWPLLQIAECLDERETDLALVSRRFAMFLLVPVVLITLLSVRLLREPLRALNQMALLVAQRGPLDLTPIDSPGAPPEMAAMSLAINSLFQRVSTGMSADRSFAATAAHELRAPLAGLRAQAQLAHVTQDPEVRSNALRQVMTAVDDGSRVIDQLLDLARVESLKGARDEGRWPLIDFAAVAEQEVDRLDLQARAKGIQLMWTPPACAEAIVSGHAGGLELLTANLIRNAVAYTPAGGKVRIAMRVGAAVELSVDDSGPGIPAADREAALMRFSRLGRTDGQGAGLGLAIVRQVVQLHDGWIELDASELGGLRVRVSLPARRAGAAAIPGRVLGV